MTRAYLEFTHEQYKSSKKRNGWSSMSAQHASGKEVWGGMVVDVFCGCLFAV